MARGAVEYRRLPGKGRTPLGSVTLWAGEDHVLLVELRGFTETYRRFYFRDVQAIVLRRTDRASVWGILLGIFGLVFLGFATGAGPVWNIVWGSVSGLLFLALALNVALGPSCECTLRTALQAVDLRSLRRLRRARRVVDRLRPHIELEQGTLASEELLARARETSAPATASISRAAGTVEVATPAQEIPAVTAPPREDPPVVLPPAVAPPVPLRPPIAGLERPLRHENGRVHEALAYVLLLSAVVVVVPVLYFNILLNGALSVVFLGRIGCLVAALARQNHSDLPQPIKKFAWTALGCEGVILALGIVTGIIMLFKMLDSGVLDPASSKPPTPMAIVELFRNNPAYKASAFLSSLTWLTLGVWGLLLQRRLVSARRKPWQTLPT